MKRDRYNALSEGSLDPSRLTPDEAAEGWHYCPDWDYLLVGPGMDEMSVCHCLPKKGRKAKEQAP